MNKTTRTVITALSIPFFVTGCLNSGNTATSAAMQQGSVMVSDVVTICGAIVGGQAEQRINEEWAKYPEAEANRSIVETMADVLLTNPDATEQQRSSQYKQYLTCAAGLFATNQMTK